MITKFIRLITVCRLSVLFFYAINLAIKTKGDKSMPTYNGYGGYMPSNPYSLYNAYSPYQQPMTPMPAQQMPMQAQGQPNMQQPMQQMAQQNVQQQAQPVQSNIPPKTNKVFVMNKEAAGNAMAEFHSDYVYFDQDEPLLYNVVTDMQGKKTITTYKIEPYEAVNAPATPEIDTSMFVTQEQFNALQEQLDALKNASKKTETKATKTEAKSE